MAGRKNGRKKKAGRKAGARTGRRRSREIPDDEIERPFIYDGVEFLPNGKIRFDDDGLAARVERYYIEKFCRYLIEHCCYEASREAGDRPDDGGGGLNSKRCGPPNPRC